MATLQEQINALNAENNYDENISEIRNMQNQLENLRKNSAIQRGVAGIVDMVTGSNYRKDVPTDSQYLQAEMDLKKQELNQKKQVYQDSIKKHKLALDIALLDQRAKEAKTRDQYNKMRLLLLQKSKQLNGGKLMMTPATAASVLRANKKGSWNPFTSENVSVKEIQAFMNEYNSTIVQGHNLVDPQDVVKESKPTRKVVKRVAGKLGGL